MSSSDILPSSPKSLLKDPNRDTTVKNGKSVVFDGKLPTRRPKFDFSNIMLGGIAPIPVGTSTASIFRPAPIEVTSPMSDTIPTSSSLDTASLRPDLNLVQPATLLPPVSSSWEPNFESLSTARVTNNPVPLPSLRLPPLEVDIKPTTPPQSIFVSKTPSPIPSAQIVEVDVKPTPAPQPIFVSKLPTPAPVQQIVATVESASLAPTAPVIIETRPESPVRNVATVTIQPTRPVIQTLGFNVSESQLFGNVSDFNEPETQSTILYKSDKPQFYSVAEESRDTMPLSGTILVSDTPRVITPSPTPTCSSGGCEFTFNYSQRVNSPSTSPPGSPSLPCPTSPSRPISPICKSNDINLIKGECFETILRKYGYTPMLKLIVQIQDKYQGEYIKCLDRLGNYVYVRLDVTGGYISVNSHDLVIERTQEISEIPYSTLHTFNDESYLILHGVAIHCKRGICFVRRHHDGSVKTEHYLYTRSNMRENVNPPSPPCVLDVMDSSLLSFPIVNLSEIQSNIVVVVQNTDDLTSRLTNNMYKNCMFECQKLKESLDRLNRVYTEFEGHTRIILEKMRESTNHYRIKVRDTLKSRSNQDPYFLQKYNLILYNIQRRQELMSELLHGTRAAGFLADQNIESVSRDIQDLSRYMQIMFSNVESELRP